MSWTMHILADSPQPLDQFAEDVASILGVGLERKSDEHDTWYEHDGDDFLLTVGEHTYENDGELRFEDYKFDIALQPHRRPNYQPVIVRWRSATGQEFFDKLKAFRRYSLLMTENLDRKVAEYRTDREQPIHRQQEISGIRNRS